MNILTIILLVIVVLLSLAYILRQKISYLTTYIPTILFPIFFLISLLAIFTIKPFNYLADKTMTGVGIYDAIIDADKTIDSLKPENLTKDIGEKVKEESEDAWDKVKDLFSGDRNDQVVETDKEELENEETENQGKANLQDENTEPGMLEGGLYPKLVNFFGIVYKIVALIVSIFGQVVIIYFAYSMQSLKDNRAQARKIKKISQKVEDLEKKINNQSQNG